MEKHQVLRVMSYNIHHGEGMDGKIDIFLQGIDWIIIGGKSRELLYSQTLLTTKFQCATLLHYKKEEKIK